MAGLHSRKVNAREKALHQRKRRGALTVLFVFIALTVIFIGIAAIISRLKLFEYRQLLMDTDVSLQVYARSFGEAGRVKDEIFDEMRRLEQLLSYTDVTSDVTKINRAAGRSPVQVSPETAAVIQKALDYAGLSEGAFDPTVAPLLEIWGFQGDHYRVPTSAEIETAVSLIGYTLLEADTAAGEILLPRPGMALDLGGIAKGYIVDRGLDLLSRAGIGHALINAGGDIGILGPKPDGSAWRIGVKHPRRESDLIAVISWSQKGAVVTSGDYERFFEEDGVRYHHILDPRTGCPARTLLSVTVVAPTAVEADALSTALFVLGPQRGLALVESLPGVEALLVTPQFELLISSGLQDFIELPGAS